MKISAKIEYACIAMIELASTYGSGEPVRIRRIAEQHGIPSHFLVQILLQLKSAGLVASTRGAAGGYQLIQPPGEITLATVMAVVEGPDEPIKSNAAASSIAARALLQSWQEVADVQREMLESVTFADLVEQAAAEHETMYYI